jgi:hypothetical protein
MAVMQFNNIQLNADTKRLVLNADKLRYTISNPNNCVLQDVINANDAECFAEADSSVRDFIQQNPLLTTLRNKKPYVVAAWGTKGTMPYSGTWPAVEGVYNGDLKVDGGAGIIVPDEMPAACKENTCKMPDLAMGVMDVTPQGSRLPLPGMEGEYNVGIDAFCSLYEHTPENPNQRTDSCENPLYASKLPDCSGGSIIANGISRHDVNHGQTCVPQSACMWRNDKMKQIKSPNWNFDFYRDWIAEYKGLPPDTPNPDWFHAKDIWRFTIDPRHVSEIYLPVGVFLQTFRPQIVDAEPDTSNTDRDYWMNGLVTRVTRGPAPILLYTEKWQGEKKTQFMNQFDIQPFKDLGMWPMCPHGNGANGGFYVIDQGDAYKSMALSENINKVMTKDNIKALGYSLPKYLPRHPWFYNLNGFMEKFLVAEESWANTTTLQTVWYTNDTRYQTPGYDPYDDATLPTYPGYRAEANTQNVCNHSDTGIKKCVIKNGYVNFRIGLAPGYVINPKKCQSNSQAYPIMGGIHRCIPCKVWSPKYCSGLNECRFPVVKDAGRIQRWRELKYVPSTVIDKVLSGDAEAMVLQLLNDANNARNVAPLYDAMAFMNEQSAMQSLVALVGNSLLTMTGGSSKMHLPISTMPIYEEEKTGWSVANAFVEYNPQQLVQYEDTLPDVPSSSSSASSRCIPVTNGQQTDIYKPNYKACNFSSQYEHLANTIGKQSSSYESPFRVKEGIIVPPSTRLAYFTSKQVMMTDGIPSWSRRERAPEDVFVQNLLDNNTQCLHGNRRESICSLHQNNLYVMNPWMGGAFNVFEADEGMQDGGCDTTFLDKYVKNDIASDSPVQLDSSCEVASTCGSSNSDQQTQWFSNIPDVCKARQSQPESLPTIPASSKHNLCTAKPKVNPLACQHPQGMLHGLQGRAWGNLYSKASLASTIGTLDVGGIFENPMAAGKRHPVASYGLMKSREDEIAGHYMSYKITKDNKLVVDQVPLNAASSPSALSSVLQSIEGSSIDWLANLAGDIAFDISQTKHMHHHTTKASNKHWTCPLREVLLWSGQYTNIQQGPWVPNPQRAGRLYSRLLTPFSPSADGMWAHPTTVSQPISPSVLHSGYWTTNGFCIYRGSLAFQSHTNEACSLAQLASSVFDGKWRNFSVMVGGSKCIDQIDWPYMQFAGRDGTVNMGFPPSDCAVLDRLSVFQHRIMTNSPVYFTPDMFSGSRTITKNSKVSNSKISNDGSTHHGGGVCKMGRAASRQVSGSGCWKIADTPTENIMRCRNVNNGQQNISWPKKNIKIPYLMVNQSMRRRQKCSQCSPPPAFVYANVQGTAKPMPAAEVGYGRPFKWETARMLAGDLRFFLCGNATECAHLQADVWTLNHFLQKYFKSPADLVNKPSNNNNSTKYMPNVSSFQDIVKEHDKRNQAEVDGYVDWYEKYLWEQEAWVICTQNGSNCSGTMSKSQWMDDRVGQCSNNVASFLSANPESLAINIDLCNINGQMDSVCKDILDSVLRITNINCILSGKDTCLEKGFFYTPSVFSSSNQEFVRSTVTSFYQRFDTDVCTADSRTQELIAQNSRLATKCTAVLLEPLKKGLEGARDVVDVVMNIVFDMLMITTDLMQLVVAVGDTMQQLVQDLMYWFQQLITDMAKTLEQIGNVLYKALLENSPLGSSFRKAVQDMCSVVEWIANYIWSYFLCYITKVFVPIAADFLVVLLGVIDVIMAVLNLIANAFGQSIPNSDIILKVTGVVKEVRDFVQQNLECGKTYKFNCYPESTFSPRTASLPVATRCWAGFQPDAGDASILSCTRADTCYQEGLSGTGASVPVVCDACPRTVAEDFLPFACSPLTKRCTCGVQKYERTRCTTHEQCYSGVQGASCMRVSTPFSKAYSTVPCKQCPTQPVCIVTSGSSPGKCLFDLLCF